MKRFLYLSLFCFILLCAVGSANAQTTDKGINDTIRLQAFVGEDGKAYGMVLLDVFEKKEKAPRNLAKRIAATDRLRRNVRKVYPYALIAADVLKDVDATVAAIPGKKQQKEYLKSVEKEMTRRFKGELEDLTITQGQILVKLISRQTGKNVFHIIKEVKNGFSASVWQGVALLFNNNLKREYDPYDRDADIETIVQEIEQGNYYDYQYRVQHYK